jgi:hypothetical protein
MAFLNQGMYPSHQSVDTLDAGPSPPGYGRELDTLIYVPSERAARGKQGAPGE